MSGTSSTPRSSSAAPTARSRSSTSTSSPRATAPGSGLAIGVAAAILPGIGLGVGAAVGAGVGAITGHIKGGMSNDDLKELGDVLNKGQAGLIVFYATNMADQVAASIKAEDRYISDAIDADADELAKQLKAAEGAEIGRASLVESIRPPCDLDRCGTERTSHERRPSAQDVSQDGRFLIDGDPRARGHELWRR